MDENKKEQKISGQGATPFAQTYFHGTKADLKVGDLIEAGFNSNYGQKKMQNIFFFQRHLTQQSGELNLHLVTDQKEYI